MRISFSRRMLPLHRGLGNRSQLVGPRLLNRSLARPSVLGSLSCLRETNLTVYLTPLNQMAWFSVRTCPSAPWNRR